MNIIIVSKNGILDTPRLFTKHEDAVFVYEQIIRELLGDDYDSVVGDSINDDTYDEVNKFLENQGKNVYYYTGIKPQIFGPIIGDNLILS